VTYLDWLDTPAHIALPDPVFLTATEAPPNLLRLKPGERVRWASLERRRTVLRVGYRKIATDYLEEAGNLLCWDGGECWPTLQHLQKFGVNLNDLSFTLARGLARKNKLGGPDRGIWVVEAGPGPETFEVGPVRNVRLGTYYQPCGSGEDYTDGGLEHPRVVVLVSTEEGEVISGDLVRVGGGK
jgi:hypothetical protein